MTATALLHAPAREPVQDLARVWPHAAAVVRAISRRRDVRDTRARLLLLLWSMRCPSTGTPRRRWYVRGAVARLGNDGVLRAWRSFHGSEPPALRTIRGHLAVLMDYLLLARSPGDQLPRLRDPEHPERRPRHPDTFHLLDTEVESDWWAAEGRAILAQNPGARWDARLWRRLLATWRARAHDRARQPVLPFPVPEELWTPRHQVPSTRSLPDAVTSASALGLAKLARRRDLHPLEFLMALRRLEVDVRGVQAVRLATDLERLRQSAALLAMALHRGDRIRRKAAWLVKIGQVATISERRRALSWAAGFQIPGG